MRVAGRRRRAVAQEQSASVAAPPVAVVGRSRRRPPAAGGRGARVVPIVARRRPYSPAQSLGDKALREAVEGLENITLNDLYAHYPDFMIDVKREQGLCETHDIIIFQHPFYWYSTPAIMKEWLDLVLTHGWAYGSEGDALDGKIFFQALSAGGDAETYKKNGYNKFTIADLTSPYQATANLCKMTQIDKCCVHRIAPLYTILSTKNPKTCKL